MGKLDQDQNDEIKENFNKIWSPTIKAGKGPFNQVYDKLKFYNENIDTLTNLNTTHASLILGMLTQPDENDEQQLQSPFFLPFNFSIEMEGLSGMVLYQKFKISEEILPPSYEKGGVDIQIKGINHTVNNSGWKTKLETLSVPAAKLSPIATSYPLNGGSTSVSDSLSPTSNSDFQGPTPNADKLRTVLTSLGYQEKGTEISNGGDITSEAADASISVFKTIKTELPNLQIKVTGGNDKFHQSLSYNSRHKAGRGIDFVISPSSQNDVDKVEKILQGYAAGSDGNFSFLNEYNNPTKAASGKHFHISAGKGTEGADNIKRAKQLAQEGKITVYNIA
jgi:hypothetical protein